MQLAKALGAGTVITSTSGAANLAFAKSLGADRVFDYKVLDIFDPGALPDNSVDVVYLLRAKHFSEPLPSKHICSGAGTITTGRRARPTKP